MKNSFQAPILIVLLFVLIANPSWAAGKPQPIAAKPIDPVQLLKSYLLPEKATAYDAVAWGVDKPSPIQWDTPGIQMIEDMTNSYGFLRRGHIPNWTVTLYGPRAGVARVQLLSPKPFQLRPALSQHQIKYEIRGCMPAGPLLLISTPGKKPAYLYSKGDNELHLWPSPPFMETQDFQTAGIQKIWPPKSCSY